MGFSSCFLRFLPLVPLAALVAEWATCFAFWIAAFLMSDPFIFGRLNNGALQLAGSDGLSVAGGARKKKKNEESRRGGSLCGAVCRLRRRCRMRAAGGQWWSSNTNAGFVPTKEGLVVDMLCCRNSRRASKQTDSGAGRGVTLYTCLVAFSQWSKRCPANLILALESYDQPPACFVACLSMRDFVTQQPSMPMGMQYLDGWDVSAQAAIFRSLSRHVLDQKNPTRSRTSTSFTHQQCLSGCIISPRTSFSFLVQLERLFIGARQRLDYRVRSWPVLCLFLPMAGWLVFSTDVCLAHRVLAIQVTLALVRQPILLKHVTCACLYCSIETSTVPCGLAGYDITYHPLVRGLTADTRFHQLHNDMC